MEKTFILWQCDNCRDKFTESQALKHAVPGTCAEWENHMMLSTSFEPVKVNAEIYVHWLTYNERILPGWIPTFSETSD